MPDPIASFRHCQRHAPHLHPAAAADTPGYAQENTTKPGLCVAVNNALGSDLFSPDKASTPCTCLHKDLLASGLKLRSEQVCTLPCALALSQVASLLLHGIEQGKYHLPSADLGQNLLVSGMTSLRCRKGAPGPRQRV